ncbi:hypothetical protein GALMADRAFT_148842 [Galerina marginata CBS 339.88]|uniref:Uncharacterized protein n=1 Tax=Galerina marginata (strain CBS 339.88) TaxID=685588 RepID=A0A067SEP7_GALM3|nr:hypothetical protein GALMADRAFT_148842 [Galerina marginata CBS 339.88]
MDDDYDMPPLSPPPHDDDEDIDMDSDDDHLFGHNSPDVQMDSDDDEIPGPVSAQTDDGDEEDDMPETFSIKEFVRTAKALYDDNLADFVKFVLTAIKDEKRVFLNGGLNGMRDDEPFEVTRDYDSLLCISTLVEVKNYITLRPLGRKEDTLTANVHLKYLFTTPTGGFTEWLHKVPNLCIGFWGPHNNLIRIYFPMLYVVEKPSALMSQDHQRTFYEKGFRPAIAKLLNIESLEWPATYDDEFWRARGRGGQLSFCTKVIPKESVPLLGDAIRDALRDNGVPWYEGLVFLHQIRGVKHATSHTDTRTGARAALDDFVESNELDYDALRLATTYIDVGLNVVSDDGKCLGWKTTGHFTILEHMLRVSRTVACRLTKPTSTQYIRDPIMHLNDVSGWRIAPGVQGRGPFECHYFQGYSTGKALTARIENGHHAKYLTCEDVLNGKATTWTRSLYELFLNAAKANLAAARMEMRVPLKNAKEVLIRVDKELLRSNLVSVSPSTWWGFGAYRVLACHLLFVWYSEGSAYLRVQPSALLMVAGLVWLLNGLLSTPDKGANSKRLMDSILPHINRHNADADILAYGTPTFDGDSDNEDSDDEEAPVVVRHRDDRETLPAFISGGIFMRRLAIGPQNPVPRLENDGLWGTFDVGRVGLSHRVG